MISGHPKSMQNRSRDPFGTPRSAQERPDGVLGATRGVPGTSRDRREAAQGRPGTPKRAPRSVRKRAKSIRMDAESRPGTQKSTQIGREAPSERFSVEFCRFLSKIDIFAKCANPLKYCACQSKQRSGPSRCESSNVQQFRA